MEMEFGSLDKSISFHRITNFRIDQEIVLCQDH